MTVLLHDLLVVETFSGIFILKRNPIKRKLNTKTHLNNRKRPLHFSQFDTTLFVSDWLPSNPRLRNQPEAARARKI